MSGSSSKHRVVFVLGGPGSGKGTQSALLVEEFKFTHLSAGDLLRAEAKDPASDHGKMINQKIKDGEIVPFQVTIALLKKAMDKQSAPTTFLIDGFPRAMDQCLEFEKSVQPGEFVLFFDCPESVMEARLLERGKSSGRTDDNKESIRKRFKTFVETSMPVVEYYEKQEKLRRVNSDRAPEEVYKDVRKLFV